MDEGHCLNSLTLSDEVANVIKERILRGEYHIGERLKKEGLQE